MASVLAADGRRPVVTLASVVGGILLWEVGARLLDDPLVFVPISAIGERFVELVQDGTLARHTWVSTQELVIGFALAAVVGITLGILTAISGLFRDALEPWLNGLYATPVVALTPLLIIYFGIDIWSKVAIVFLVSVFPIWITTHTGVRATDLSFIDVARSFGATRRQILTKVFLQSALPYIVAGFRLGIGRGIVGVVVGELFAARAGLGYLIITSSQIFDTAGVYVGVIVLAVTGVVSVELLRRLERRLAPWRDTRAAT